MSCLSFCKMGSERVRAMLQLVNAIIVIALAAFAMFAYEHGNLVPNRARLLVCVLLLPVTHSCAEASCLHSDMAFATLS